MNRERRGPRRTAATGFTDTYHQRRVVSESQQSQSQTVQDIYDASDTGVLPKSHYSLPARIHQLFVVYQPDVLVCAAQTPKTRASRYITLSHYGRKLQYVSTPGYPAFSA